MVNKEIYNELPFDLAGSRAKNRFRAELLWGIIKLYEVDKECTMVFDYWCDIEVHLEKEKTIEFYQIKTDKDNASYTIDRLCKPNSKKESILGKVYILKKIIDDKSPNTFTLVKSCVVSNIPFSGSKKYTTPTELCFSELAPEDKESITTALKKELQVNNIDLSTIFFNYHQMDLKNITDALLGKTFKYAKRILNAEPKNLEGLLARIEHEVNNKACYEYKNNNYEELLKNKGFRKSELNSLIKDFNNVSDDIIHKISTKIDRLYPNEFFKTVKLKKSLSELNTRYLDDKILKIQEEKIKEYLLECENKFECSEKDLIEKIKQLKIYNLEDDDYFKEVLILYVLTKFEEVCYE